MKSLGISLTLIVLCGLCACSVLGDPKTSSRILVVDERGAVVPDALLLPEEEGHDPSSLQGDREEDYAPRSGQDGVITTNLDEYLRSDDCYHFRIHKRGYEDTASTVSRDLMPPVLKVELRSRAYYLQTQGARP
jgi:hypothetical protein